METLDITEASFMVDDDILNFTLDDENEETKTIFKAPFASCSSSLESPNASINPEAQTGSFTEYEEDLEWLSNKEAFPEVETCFGILCTESELMSSHQSPVSVLENSSSSSKNASGNNSSSTVANCCGNLKVPKNYPVGARSKRRRRRVDLGNMTSQQCLWLDQVNVKKSRQELPVALPPSPMKTNNGATLGRKCLHCQVDKTPQWRAGPMGPKTLCNACGVRYKSGRLFPEYRPASSPTFSSALHSNSHRKVIEMRRQQQQLSTGGVTTVSEACGYRE